MYQQKIGLAKESPPPSVWDSVQDKDSLLRQGYVSPRLESDVSATHTTLETINKMTVAHGVQLHFTVDWNCKSLHREQTLVTSCVLFWRPHQSVMTINNSALRMEMLWPGLTLTKWLGNMFNMLVKTKQKWHLTSKVALFKHLYASFFLSFCCLLYKLPPR